MSVFVLCALFGLFDSLGLLILVFLLSVLL